MHLLYEFRQSFSDTDALLDEFQFIHSINVYLNKTIPPSQRVRFSTTQLIADALRTLGYDGVKYLSSVGLGCDLTFFNPKLLIYQPQEQKVLNISGLQYSYVELPLLEEE